MLLVVVAFIVVAVAVVAVAVVVVVKCCLLLGVNGALAKFCCTTHKSTRETSCRFKY